MFLVTGTPFTHVNRDLLTWSETREGERKALEDVASWCDMLHHEMICCIIQDRSDPLTWSETRGTGRKASWDGALSSVVHRAMMCCIIRDNGKRPIEWWLLLLLVTVVQYPWLRVYVVQIHVDLGSRFFEFLPESNRHDGNIEGLRVKHFRMLHREVIRCIIRDNGNNTRRTIIKMNIADRDLESRVFIENWSWVSQGHVVLASVLMVQRYVDKEIDYMLILNPGTMESCPASCASEWIRNALPSSICFTGQSNGLAVGLPGPLQVRSLPL